MIMKMDTFRKFYLMKKISSQVSLVCHSSMILSNFDKLLRILNFCVKIFTFLP